MPLHPRTKPRTSLILAACVFAPAMWLSAGPVRAGFFDFLSPPAPPAHQAPPASSPTPAPVTSHAGPSPRVSVGLSPTGAPSTSPGAGQTVDFCVRLCDGRSFPVARRTGATPVQVCSALCPAAKTRIFHGSEIAHARAGDGTRYADLDNAFVYRKTLVPSCTCNGKDAFGTAPVDLAGDPTLRAGDLVATGAGLVKSPGAAPKARADLTPVDPAQMQNARRKLVTASATPAR